MVDPLSRLQIFIDESGSPDLRERFFLGAAVWCAPITGGVQSTLRYTVDQLRINAGKGGRRIPREMHYSDGLWRNATEVAVLIFKTAIEDGSIRKKDLLWSGHPLANAMSFRNPQMEWELTEDDDVPNRIRARIISELLQPLFTFNGGYRLDVDVVLDSECWKRSVEYVKGPLDRSFCGNDVHLNFLCENSKKVPGLQLADVLAGISRHHRMGRDVMDAHDLIGRRTIYRFDERPTMKK